MKQQNKTKIEKELVLLEKEIFLMKDFLKKLIVKKTIL